MCNLVDIKDIDAASTLLQKVKIWENLQNLAQKDDLKAKLNDIFPLLNKDVKDGEVKS